MRRLMTALLAVTPACELVAQGTVARSCEGTPVSVVSVEPQRPDFHGPMRWWRATARALGLRVPADMLARATEVVD